MAADFRIDERPGREQPFTVWRGHEVWQFCRTRQEAIDYIAFMLTSELQEN